MFGGAALLQRIIHDERGAGLVEYGLVVILIAIVAIAAVSQAGNETSELYSEIVDGFP